MTDEELAEELENIASFFAAKAIHETPEVALKLKQWGLEILEAAEKVRNGKP
jgi:hypothetical protein